MISFEPLKKTLEQKGIKRSRLLTEKMVNGGANSILVKAMDGRGNGDNLTIGTINRLCRALDCDISDIIEYLPEGDSTE